tara:strand:- start:979 stop:1293 length:315 start_codon:yes stop_codon:yes gene_type:complete
MKERDYRGVTYDHAIVLAFEDIERLPNGFKILEAHGFPRLTMRMDGNLVWAIRVQWDDIGATQCLAPRRLQGGPSRVRVAWFDAMTCEYIADVSPEEMEDLKKS